MKYERIILFVFIIYILSLLSACKPYEYIEIKHLPANPVEESGQVRNCATQLNNNNLLELYGDDLIYQNFQDTGYSYDIYEQKLLKEAEAKGLDTVSLKSAIDAAIRLKGDNAVMYPVIIETAKYSDKDCYIFVLTWEMKQMIESDNDKVQPLGHIYIAVIEMERNNLLYGEGCR